MPRHPHKVTSEDQLGLALTGEGFQGPAETHGLLSAVYLTRHLKESDHFASPPETIPAYEVVCSLMGDHIAALRLRNEAFTCSTFLEPLLDVLRWRRIPQQSMPSNTDIGTAPAIE